MVSCFKPFNMNDIIYMGLSGLSAIALAREGEDDEARLERLVAWMDLRLAGWSDHVAEDRRQAGIDIAHLGGTDVEVANGVVHVIDGVVLPS